MRRGVHAAALLVGLTLASAAHAAASSVSSGLTCRGANTMQALVANWMRIVHRQHPLDDYTVVKGSTFSAEGVRALLKGRVNCVTFAREPFPSEVRAFIHRFGTGPVVIPVAQGSFATPHGTFAIAVYVNRRNPLRRMTVDQLRRILSTDETGGIIERWGALGLGGSWRHRRIHVYGMTPRRETGNPPGIVNFVDRRVMQGNSWRTDLRIQIDSPRRSALTAIVEMVASDPAGIGYSGIGYANRSVIPLALSRTDEGPYFLPTSDNVASGRYPLSRTIYLGFPTNLSARARRDACDLLAAILSRRGQMLVKTDRMHFGRLTSSMLREARREVDRKLACGVTKIPRGPVRSDLGETTVHARLRGQHQFRIVGYNDMASVIKAWDRYFLRSHPHVQFVLLLHGTRTAPRALAREASLLAPMGAPFSARQLRAYRKWQHTDPLAFRVAHASNDPRALSSPLAIYVNTDNPLRTIGMGQLRTVLARSYPRTRPIWGDLGITGSWAVRQIEPCGLAPDTALGRYIKRHVLRGANYTAGYLAFSESSAVVDEVASEPNALCFADLNRVKRGARLLGLSRGAGRGVFTGTRAEIQSGAYPLDRYLYLYARRKNNSNAERKLLCEYLDLVLSPTGQRLLATAPPGYIPLNRHELRVERAHLAQFACARR